MAFAIHLVSRVRHHVSTPLSIALVSCLLLTSTSTWAARTRSHTNAVAKAAELDKKRDALAAEDAAESARKKNQQNGAPSSLSFKASNLAEIASGTQTMFPKGQRFYAEKPKAGESETMLSEPFRLDSSTMPQFMQIKASTDGADTLAFTLYSMTENTAKASMEGFADPLVRGTDFPFMAQANDESQHAPITLLFEQGSLSLIDGTEGEELDRVALTNDHRHQFPNMTEARNVLARIRAAMLEDENLSPKLPNDAEQLLFKKGYLGQPDDNLSFADAPSTGPITIGFNDTLGRDNITTSMEGYPLADEYGMSIGPLKLTYGDKKDALFTLHVSAPDGDTFQATLYAYQGSLEADNQYAINALLFDDLSPALASLTMTRDEHNIKVTLMNKASGSIRHTERSLNYPWDEVNDRITIFPMTSVNTAEKMYVPALGTCLNILAEAINNGDITITEDNMLTLVSPMGSRTGTADGYIYSSVYRSDVVRNFQYIPHRDDNATRRNIKWVGKKARNAATAPFHIAYEHPKTTLATGVVLFSLAATGAGIVDPQTVVAPLSSAYDYVAPMVTPYLPDMSSAAKSNITTNITN